MTLVIVDVICCLPSILKGADADTLIITCGNLVLTWDVPEQVPCKYKHLITKFRVMTV